MRSLVVILLFLNIYHLNAQVKWSTASRVGINRIGIGFDQTVSYCFGKTNNNIVSIGAKWYGLDYVFEKETLGLVLDYHYSFPGVPKGIQFSLGLNAAYFREKKENNQFSLLELTLNNRGTYTRFFRLQPFYELGIGMVNNTGLNSNGLEINGAYLNYYFALGLQVNFSDKKND